MAQNDVNKINKNKVKEVNQRNKQKELRKTLDIGYCEKIEEEDG